MMNPEYARGLGDRFIAVKDKDYDGSNWLVGSIPDEGDDGGYTITTDHRKADEVDSNSTYANLFAASITLYHANKFALDAILNSRPDTVPLTPKEQEAVRWLRSAIRYAETGEWSDPEPPFKTATKGNAPMLSFNHKPVKSEG